MPMSDTEYAPLFKISPGNWVLIIGLITALSGWGLNTRANTNALEKKADKEMVEAQLAAMQRDLQEIKTDVREIRNNQDRVRVDLVDRQLLEERRDKRDKVIISNAK